ncbi:hypothetical protein EII17_05370 [Clostridiales bacterium COT073_COT-073]|nr:hypothetical protein EII17_05370 [Clostridiales bacterium COT073_COT-073]
MHRRLSFPEAEVTKSLSRVIKQNYVAISAEKRLIENFRDFRPMLDASEVKDNAAIRAVQAAADEFQQEAEQLEKMSIQINQAEELNACRQEADKILAEANANKNKIYEDAYKAGMEEAKAELERRKAILEQEYAAKIESLEERLTQEYQTKYNLEIQHLEGKMVLWLQGMLGKLVGQAQQSEKVLIHLIRMGMQEIALQGDLIIRVSEEDLDYVLEHKAVLTEELSEKLTIEVLKDKNLKKNQCIIETIMGNIECSLDVQLKGITDELRLIYESIMKNVHL